MSTPTHDDPEEKPLDPAVARVQARLQRLLLVAGLTLGLGLLAVFAGIIYRIGAMDNTTEPAAEIPGPKAPASIAAPMETPAPPAEAGVRDPVAPARAIVEARSSVPADARLVASTVVAGRIVLTYETYAGTIVLTVDPETLAVVGRLEVKPSP